MDKLDILVIIGGSELRLVTKYAERLRRLIAATVKSSMYAHGKVDPGSVAGQMWARTLPTGHANLANYILWVRVELGLTQHELADTLRVH